MSLTRLTQALSFLLTLLALTVGGIAGLSRLVHVSVLVILLVLLAFEYRNGLGLPNERALAWAIAFVCYASLSILWAIKPIGTFVRSIELITSLCVFIALVTAIRRTGALSAVLAALLLGASINAAVAISQYTDPLVTTARASGTMGNPNALGFQLSIVALLLLALIQRRSVPLIAIVVFLLGVASVTTGSRKTLIAWGPLLFVALVPLLPGRLTYRRLGAAVFLIPVMVVAAGALWAAYGGLVFEIKTVIRAIESVASGQPTSSDATRLDLLKEGLAVWRANPIIGVGFDNFRVLNRFNFYAHNLYVELLASLGLLGLLFYVGLFGSVIRCVRAARARSFDLLLVLGLYALLDLTMVTINHRSAWIFLAVFVGVGGATVQMPTALRDLLPWRWRARASAGMVVQ